MINNISGFNDTKFWIGIIEDRVDPLGLGRCKVRVHGYHTEDKTQLSTEDLPWVHPVFAMNNSKSYFPPNQNDWVLGIYLDGNAGQFGMMLGIIPGLKNE